MVYRKIKGGRVMIFELNKLINDNIKKSCYLSCIIEEYDIENAGATAIRFIIGEDEYHRLMSIEDKSERVREIGLLRRNNRHLTDSITQLTLSWMNEFIRVNKITERNFLASTPDSLLIMGKVPVKTVFEDGKVVFRNKEKVKYTSLFYLKNGHNKIILFDRYTKRIRIKGLGLESKTSEYPFINKYLKNFLSIIEDSISNGQIKTMKKIKTQKINYFNSSNPEIYRSITNENMYRYIIDGEEVYSDTLLEETKNCKLCVNDNYINFIYPLIRIFV